MTETDVAFLLRETMVTAFRLGTPPLLAALAVGLLVSLLQAVTQINEATLAFVPKIVAIGLSLVIFGTAMTGSLIAFAQMLFARIGAPGG
jgi:flagellar biosynthetic protein FliQ